MAFTVITSALALCVLVASIGTLRAQTRDNPSVFTASDVLDSVTMVTDQGTYCVWIQAPEDRQIEITFGTVNIDSGRDTATGMCDQTGDRLLFIDRPKGDSYVLLELCEKNKKPLSIVSSGAEMVVCYLHKAGRPRSTVAFEYAVTDICDGYAKIIYTEKSPNWIHSPYVENTNFTVTAYPEDIKFQHELRPTGSSGIQYWFSRWGVGSSNGQCRGEQLFISNPDQKGKAGARKGFCGVTTPSMKICHFGNVIFYEIDTNGNGANKGYVGEWKKCEQCGGTTCPPTGQEETTTSGGGGGEETTTSGGGGGEETTTSGGGGGEESTTTLPPAPPTCPESCLTDMYNLEFPSPYYGIKTEEYDYDAVEAYLAGLGCGDLSREDVNGVDTIKFSFAFENCPSLKPTLNAETGDLVFALNIKFFPDYQNCQDCDGNNCGYRIYTKNTLTYSVVCNVHNPTLPPNIVVIKPTALTIDLEERLTPTFEKCICDCEDCSNCRNNIVPEGFNLQFQEPFNCGKCNFWKFCAIQTNPNFPSDFYIRAKQIYSYRTGPLDYRILFFRNNIVEMSGNAAKLNAEITYEYGLVCFRLLPFCYPKLASATSADSNDKVNIRMDLIVCDDANTGNDVSCARDPNFCYRKTPRDCTAAATQGRSLDILTGQQQKRTTIKLITKEIGLQTECSAHSKPKCGAWPVVGN